jgi:hypothetical protein
VVLRPALPSVAVRPWLFSIGKGACEMTKKLDLVLILTLVWLFLHRIVLNWFKHFLGVG